MMDLAENNSLSYPMALSTGQDNRLYPCLIVGATPPPPGQIMKKDRLLRTGK
jgi:hypothetical protein